MEELTLEQTIARLKVAHKTGERLFRNYVMASNERELQSTVHTFYEFADRCFAPGTYHNKGLKEWFDQIAVRKRNDYQKTLKTT